MLERMLKLSLPTLYWWLAMFYTLFDLWLNVLAEILRFGDREFYKVGGANFGCACAEQRRVRRAGQSRGSRAQHGEQSGACRAGHAEHRGPWAETKACACMKLTHNPCPAAAPPPPPPPPPPQEWWNATTVGEYWRLWNQPVHKVGGWVWGRGSVFEAA